VKKIRKKQGYLEGFQKQNRTISIGIIGAVPGCGTTTMAIAMGNYLAGITRNKVAVYEHNSKRTFMNMCEYFGESNTVKHHKCTYYSKDSIRLSNLYNEGYDIVIIDFGAERANIGEFIRCTYKVVVASLEPWNYLRIVDFNNMAMEVSGSDTWLMILNGDKSAVKKHRKKTSMHILKRPFIDNPFIIDNSLVEFFEALF
jgi:hypothetical protein